MNPLDSLRHLAASRSNAILDPTNPGHYIYINRYGSMSASSSAPSNRRQHFNVAPPQHQRAHPTNPPGSPF